MKRIVLLTAIILFSATSVFAQSGTAGPLTWVLENNTLTISGEGAMPDYGDEFAPWHVYWNSIYTVVIESGVTTIGNYAFGQCENMLSITIPNSVTNIGDGGFLMCMSLLSIVIPNSVTEIGDGSFIYCKSLTSIDVESENNYYVSENGILFDKNKTTLICYPAGKTGTVYVIPDGVIKINNHAFWECKNLTSVTLPNSVTTIEWSAFYLCENLISVIISGNNLTTIKRDAFTNCRKLTSITLPNSVTTIEERAFFSCYSLPSITIPDGVTTISSFVFGNCYSLTSVTLPNSVTTIGRSAFYWCLSLPSITIPESVTSIGELAFFTCVSLTSVTIPDGVTKIGDSTFFGCQSLPSITIPNNITSIGNDVFVACKSLTSIDVDNENNNYVSENGVLFDKNKSTLMCYPAGKTAATYIIPNSVTSVKRYAFAYCDSIASITIPNSVTTIEYATFALCAGLTSVIIPNSVKSIGDAAFWYCTSLTSITCLNPKPVTISPTNSVFYGINQNACTLTVPTSAVSAYQKANVWKEFNIVGGGILVNPVANNSKYGYTTGDGLYEEGETATVTATARDGYKFVKWTKSGSEVSTNSSYSFTVTEDVELVANFEENVGIDEQLKITNYELRIYPNPTRGELTITNYELRITNIEIFDVMGKFVATVETHGRASLQCDITYLPSGIYFVRIQTDKGVITRKVVKN